jgi:hypothetical protein
MTQHDEKKGGDANKKRLADERAAREKKQVEQREAMAGVKPTPTQEENDLAATGEHLTEHEPDGSPEQPPAPPPDPPPEGGATAHRETKPSQQPTSRGDYSTRTAAPAKHE